MSFDLSILEFFPKYSLQPRSIVIGDLSLTTHKMSHLPPPPLFPLVTLFLDWSHLHIPYEKWKKLIDLFFKFKDSKWFTIFLILPYFRRIKKGIKPKFCFIIYFPLEWALKLLTNLAESLMSSGNRRPNHTSSEKSLKKEDRNGTSEIIEDLLPGVLLRIPV